MALYYSLRFFLHQKRWVLRLAQRLRAFIVLGPCRDILIRYHQKFGKNEPLSTDNTHLFPSLNVGSVVEQLQQVGYADRALLSEDCIAEILEFCQKTRRVRYWNPHQECEAIDRLARNVKVVEVASRYLGAPPILWLTQLKWSFGEEADRRKFFSSGYQEPLQHDGHAFHYDALDYKSLTVFVYLTDVDLDAGPHIVIENTHSNKTLRDIEQIILSDEHARQRYDGKIKVITGKKGTMFFEETSCYHKASICRTSRLMLSIDYVLQRPPPPPRPHFARQGSGASGL